MKNFNVKLLLVSIWFMFSYSYSGIANPPIKGTITYHEQTGVENMQLFLSDINNNIIDSAITNSNGEYIFSNINFGDYTLSANLDQISSGVDLEDAYLIEQHLLGNDTLSDFQLYSADVNGDDSVTWDDYYIITDWWLTYGIPFPAGDWKFQELNIAFYSSADGNNNDTKVTSTGDVNGGGLPDKITPANIETLPYEQIAANKTDIIEVPVYVENALNIYGYHLSIKYNEEIVEILDVKTLNSKGKFNAADGVLKITCLNPNNNIIPVERHTAIATIRMKLKETDQNSDLVSFSLTDLPQLMNEQGKLLKNVQLSIPEIKIETESFDIMNSYPNPFVTTTNLFW